ncbi:MAG: histidinol-phosphatase [Pseudomonadota bacterium]
MLFDSDIRRVAHLMADAAREVILPYFRNSSLVAQNKQPAGFDPVTEADRASEEKMRAILASERPNDAIIGEEFGENVGTTGLTWVLDPIDGTRGFVSGTPTWGVLIAVSDENGPFYGLIDQPYIGERFEGAPDGALMQGPAGQLALATRAVASLSEATLFTTFPEIGTAQERAGFSAVAQQAKLVRYGMDCYAYALVAAGHADLVIEAGLAAYDIQAPIAVIQAAGGLVTDWQGLPAHQGGQVVAAGDAKVHAQALDILKNSQASRL